MPNPAYITPRRHVHIVGTLVTDAHGHDHVCLIALTPVDIKVGNDVAQFVRQPLAFVPELTDVSITLTTQYA